MTTSKPATALGTDEERVQYGLHERADNPLTFTNLPQWLMDGICDKLIKPVFKTEDYWYLSVKTGDGTTVDIGPDDYITYSEAKGLGVALSKK